MQFILQQTYNCVVVVVCSRVIKTDEEIALLKYANKISSDAHKKVYYVFATVCLSVQAPGL